jgi:hypothetical protein
LEREDGQATFEFALVSIGLILFVLAVVDGALLMYNYVSASNAVRDAARYASVNCSGGCTEAAVLDRAADGSGGFMDSADFETILTGTSKGDSVIVRVKDSYAYDFLFFPVNFPVASCAQMRLEQDETGSVDEDANATCGNAWSP